jgi:hypothetical protein
MISKTRRTSYACPTFDLKGYEARLSLCSDCGTTFYGCPVCGKKDLKALKKCFREKFRERGIELLPPEQLDKSS